MPAHNSLRFHDDQAPSPTSKPAAGENPEATIFIMQSRLDLAALENNQLMPKTEVFGNQSCPGLENGGESVGKAPNH
jgi:hypothetical protein